MLFIILQCFCACFQMFSVTLFRSSSIVRLRKRMAWRPLSTTSVFCSREWPHIPRGKSSHSTVTRMTLSFTSTMETSLFSVNRIWSKTHFVHASHFLFFLFSENYQNFWYQTSMSLFLRVFGSQNLTTVKLSGVGSSFKKHSDAESKGIKAHFNMDESGVLVLDRVGTQF